MEIKELGYTNLYLNDHIINSVCVFNRAQQVDGRAGQAPLSQSGVFELVYSFKSKKGRGTINICASEGCSKIGS